MKNLKYNRKLSLLLVFSLFCSVFMPFGANASGFSENVEKFYNKSKEVVGKVSKKVYKNVRKFAPLIPVLIATPFVIKALRKKPEVKASLFSKLFGKSKPVASKFAALFTAFAAGAGRKSGGAAKGAAKGLLSGAKFTAAHIFTGVLSSFVTMGICGYIAYLFYQKNTGPKGPIQGSAKKTVRGFADWVRGFIGVKVKSTKKEEKGLEDELEDAKKVVFEEVPKHIKEYKNQKLKSCNNKIENFLDNGINQEREYRNRFFKRVLGGEFFPKKRNLKEIEKEEEECEGEDDEEEGIVVVVDEEKRALGLLPKVLNYTGEKAKSFAVFPFDKALDAQGKVKNITEKVAEKIADTVISCEDKFWTTVLRDGPQRSKREFTKQLTREYEDYLRGLKAMKDGGKWILQKGPQAVAIEKALVPVCSALYNAKERFGNVEVVGTLGGALISGGNAIGKFGSPIEKGVNKFFEKVCEVDEKLKDFGACPQEAEEEMNEDFFRFIKYLGNGLKKGIFGVKDREKLKSLLFITMFAHCYVESQMEKECKEDGPQFEELNDNEDENGLIEVLDDEDENPCQVPLKKSECVEDRQDDLSVAKVKVENSVKPSFSKDVLVKKVSSGLKKLNKKLVDEDEGEEEYEPEYAKKKAFIDRRIKRLEKKDEEKVGKNVFDRTPEERFEETCKFYNVD